jgi:hypothetical protein
LEDVRNYVEKIEVLEENNQYRIGEIGFSAAQKHRHKGETRGINFKIKPRSVSLISDGTKIDLERELKKESMLS